MNQTWKATQIFSQSKTHLSHLSKFPLTECHWHYTFPCCQPHVMQVIKPKFPLTEWHMHILFYFCSRYHASHQTHFHFIYPFKSSCNRKISIRD
jgi:hypothetical protein